MIGWLKDLWSLRSFEAFCERLDKRESERSGEVWHYICENGHKWDDWKSPRGTCLYGKSGQTKCPTCKTSVCMGNVYINGKKTQMGAVHCYFGKRRKG